MAEPRKFGWIKDPESHKDKKYSLRVHAVSVSDLPRKTENHLKAPPVVNQFSVGSCVGNAVGAGLQHGQILQGAENFMPSRLFIYYCTRIMEGTVKSDNGCCIRNAIKVVAHLGAPPERMWPYEEDKFANCPPYMAYKEARKHQAIDYYRVDWRSLNEVKVCLAGGHGIIFGFQVPEHFMSAEVSATGILHMPTNDEVFVGGHAVYALDYDDDIMFPSWPKPGGVFVQNSWGSDWGIKGRFWMPYDYITSPTLSDDFWTIRKVEA